jgi:hypothetical protein
MGATSGRQTHYWHLEQLRYGLPATPYVFASPAERKLYDAYRDAIRASRASNKKPSAVKPKAR